MNRTITSLMLMACAVLAACTATAQTENGSINTDAITNIMTRTSIRSWEDQPVEKAKIETMLKAAMAAPTAINRQPWHFVVLSDRADIDRLAGEGRGSGMVRKAPLAIVVCGDTTRFIGGPGRDFWIEDTSAATENLLLAAHALGLGAVWTGVYPDPNRVETTRKALGLSERFIPMCTVLIGYPHEHPTPKDKWNPDNITWGIQNK